MHFKNLNSVRALAAALVMVHHIEQLKEIYGLPAYYRSPPILLAGKLGVIVFFALSGFLITSLLLAEQRLAGSLALGKFYLRRMLRIWPLYFLVVLLSLFVWPHVRGMQLPGLVNPHDRLVVNLVLDTLLLPNLQLYLVGAIPFSAQVWSVGVEEQFYLCWPLVVGLGRYVPLRSLVLALLGGFLLLKLLPFALPPTTPGLGRLLQLSVFMTHYWPMNCLLWGALFATLRATGTWRAALTSRAVQVAGYALFGALAAGGVRLGNGMPGALQGDMYAVLAALLLYNLVQPTSLLSLEYGWLSRLGTWSYGLYMLHMLVAWPLVQLAGRHNWVLYPLVFASSIALAAGSYTLLEKPFLRLKERFAVLKTSAEAPPASA